MTGPSGPSGPFGRPTGAELVAAVAEFLDADVRGATDGQVNFPARVAANVLRIVERELGADTAAVVDEQDLVAAIRAGDFDGRDDDVMTALRNLNSERLAQFMKMLADANFEMRLRPALSDAIAPLLRAFWSPVGPPAGLRVAKCGSPPISKSATIFCADYHHRHHSAGASRCATGRSAPEPARGIDER